jgi:hypothetical protein
LKTAFEWGDMKFAPDVLTFCGREVRDMGDHVLVSQTAYIDSTMVKPISRGREKGPAELSPEELVEFRSQWMATTSRPDVAAGTSLAKSGSPTIASLKELYELVSWSRGTKEMGVTLWPLELDLAKTIVVSFTDSSFANAPGGKTQGGLLVTLASRAALMGSSIGSLIDWKSGRVKRVVRSTLAGEACAADAGVDHGHFVARCLSKLLGHGDAVSEDSVFEHYHAMDCRSLYDAVHKDSGDLAEKRTLLDVKAIRRGLPPRNLRWVPTEWQWADGLTKDENLREKFATWLMRPEIRLHE